MIATSYSVGAVAAGEGALEIRPKFPPVSARRGTMFVHGAGSDATYCIAPYGKQSTTTGRIVETGTVAFSGDIGGTTTWGNATAMARMSSAYTYLQGRTGVAPGPVALVSGSMGGLTSLNWAAQNRDKVACVVTVIPVINPNDIVVNNRDGYAASVNSAYAGGWSQATYGSTYNPLTLAQAGKFAGLPILIFYGLTDTLCVPAQAEAFAAAVGSTVTLVPLPTGHEEATYASVDADRAAAFVAAYTGV